MLQLIKSNLIITNYNLLYKIPWVRFRRHYKSPCFAYWQLYCLTTVKFLNSSCRFVLNVLSDRISPIYLTYHAIYSHSHVQLWVKKFLPFSSSVHLLTICLWLTIESLLLAESQRILDPPATRQDGNNTLSHNQIFLRFTGLQIWRPSCSFKQTEESLYPHISRYLFQTVVILQSLKFSLFLCSGATNKKVTI